MNWIPDPELLEQTIEVGDRWIAELMEYAHQGWPEESTSLVQDFCEACGALAYLDRENLVRKWMDLLPELAHRVEGFFRDWELLELREARMQLKALEPALMAALRDPNREEEVASPSTQANRLALFEELESCLVLRDAVQLQVRGATVILGTEPALQEDAQDHLALFDQELESLLFLCIPINERRRNRVSWIAPTFQHEFWWWEKGSLLPSKALDSFFEAVEIIQEIPASETFLNYLLDARKRVQEEMERTDAEDHQRPLPLRSLLQPAGRTPQHPGEATDPDDGVLDMVAEGLKTTKEWETLLETEDFFLLGDGKRLKVLLKYPVAPDNDAFAFLPVAFFEIPSEEQHVLPILREAGRWAVFDLSDPRFSASAGILHVQCGNRRSTFDITKLGSSPT